MQRIHHLFETFCSFSNLYEAWRRAKRGTSTNLDKNNFCFNAETELLHLQEELIELRYRPQPYRYFQIHDPKTRTISVASFRDRVVHHALVGVLEPFYEKWFIYDSYATRKGKGTHKAIARAQSFLKHNPWFLKSDIDHFFDTIQHDTLLKLMSERITDPNLMIVAERIIRAGGREPPGLGLPIGNLTSQFFANVYLDPFDHFIKEHLSRTTPIPYLRYMDDFVLFSTEKTLLSALGQAGYSFLNQKLGLQINARATFLNQATNGLSFLGRRIFKNSIRRHPVNLRRMKRRGTYWREIF